MRNLKSKGLKASSRKGSRVLGLQEKKKMRRELVSK